MAGSLTTILEGLTNRAKAKSGIDDLSPRRLLVRSAKKAINMDRELLLTSFGFKETIAENVVKAGETARIGVITDKSRQSEARQNKPKEIGGRKTLL